MDLRVAERRTQGHGSTACGTDVEGLSDWELRLMVGSGVAAEARAAVKVCVPIDAAWQCRMQDAGLHCTGLSSVRKIVSLPGCYHVASLLPVRETCGLQLQLE
jgi:hypothetical protein